MSAKVTAFPADPWDLIPEKVREYVARTGKQPTRVRIPKDVEAAFDGAAAANPVFGRPKKLRTYRTVYGLTPEWDAERLEVL